MNVQLGTYTQNLQGKVQQIYITLDTTIYNLVTSKKLYKENRVSYISTCFSTQKLEIHTHSLQNNI
jgi:hypothetical protein